MSTIQQFDTTNPPVISNPFGLRRAAYSLRETIEVLSLSRSSVYELVKCGELKPVKVGAKSLFLATDIAAFLSRLQERADAQNGHAAA
jgi:excisionase family DNA binding protein